MSSDYGICIYRPSSEPGTLEATWFEAGLPQDKPCRGLAVGGPSEGLAGSYQVTYFGPDGAEAACFDLDIKRTDHTFSLTWKKDGKVACTGVGLPLDDGLALAYRTQP
ncbi:hypothetical protein [Kordiimonas lacus]|uniref:Uncharacterized protein n=1 Tax=Kordiimonas lacus TaxID=637679 RepID=A0A1G6Y712_9PROT|nr:hypothetical protein [Kordiimonas lacus]SDD85497.1 hypothetical protein SAMN04488071_1489 [Kordiimonas lacus]